MRILIATDGSPSAGLAVDLVAGTGWPAGTEVRVVQAIETGVAAFGGPWPAAAIVQADALEAALRDAARDSIERARIRLAQSGLLVTGDVLRGRPGSAIVEEAGEMGADVIVLGSRGHGTIESMLLGSVSAEVVDHAAVPVLVARGTSVARVVLAWDGSDGARVAAGLVRTWPVFTSSSVHVLSVADVNPPWWTGFPDPASSGVVSMYLEAAEASREVHAALARGMAAELGASGIEAIPEPREGDAATEILAAARAFEADLIVLGTRGRTGLVGIVLGSVARNVLHHASCSVLIAREASRPA